MTDSLVLVNGLPGAGKTTLGRALAAATNARLLSKDEIKEALAACAGDDIPELGGIAMDAVWALARATQAPVIIDSWWFEPRDLRFAEAGIAATGAPRAVEIWCDIPADLARSRYANRRRNPIHHDERRLAEDWDIWAARAAPLALTPVMRVDTTGAVDIAALAEAITTVLSGGRPRG